MINSSLFINRNMKSKIFNNHGANKAWCLQRLKSGLFQSSPLPRLWPCVKTKRSPLFQSSPDTSCLGYGKAKKCHLSILTTDFPTKEIKRSKTQNIIIVSDKNGLGWITTSTPAIAINHQKPSWMLNWLNASFLRHFHFLLAPSQKLAPLGAKITKCQETTYSYWLLKHYYYIPS